MNHAVKVPTTVELITMEAGAVSKDKSVGHLLDITLPVSPATPLRVSTPLKVGLGIGLAAFGGNRTTALTPVGIVIVVAPIMSATGSVSATAAAVVMVIGPKERAPSSPPETFAARVIFPEAAIGSPSKIHLPLQVRLQD